MMRELEIFKEYGGLSNQGIFIGIVSALASGVYFLSQDPEIDMSKLMIGCLVIFMTGYSMGESCDSKNLYELKD